MTTTFSQIAQFADNRNLKYGSVPGQPCLVMGFGTPNVEKFAVVILLSENGRYLQFQAPKLLQVKDHVFMGMLFKAMANIQHSVKMLRLEYNISDGEIRASIELPLEDSPLTETQFNRCLDGLIQLVDRSMPRLKTILATGNDPGQKNAAEQLLDAIPSDIRQQLQAALLRRQAD